MDWPETYPEPGLFAEGIIIKTCQIDRIILQLIFAPGPALLQALRVDVWSAWNIAIVHWQSLRTYRHPMAQAQVIRSSAHSA
jgi:hypothetical protein